MPPKATKAAAPKTKKKKAATAKPRKVAKPCKAAAATGSSVVVKFRGRGPHKCTTVDGKGVRGMHSALAAAIGAGFNYDAAKKAGTLKVLAHPVSTKFFARHAHARNERRLAYSATQGKKADSQMTAVFKLHTGAHKVPLRCFVDQAFLDHWKLVVFGKTSTSLDVGRQIKRIRAVANTLLPENDAVVRFLLAENLTPVGTQTPVACGSVGTQCDMVVKNAAGQHQVLELKCGCESNYSHGKLMPPPLHGLLYTTHREHTLQTLMTSRCYRRTFPLHKVGPPLLLRSDRMGLFVYDVPAWAKDAEAALAVKMGMQ